MPPTTRTRPPIPPTSRAGAPPDGTPPTGTSPTGPPHAGTLPPRAVFVVRETEYELLLARHATRDQGRFFLHARRQTLDPVEARHRRFNEVLAQARAAVPANWRQATVNRADLDRFLFAAEDVVIPVGQDGLVANVAKYLRQQPVVGINPFPDLFDGVLTRIRVDDLSAVLAATAAGRARLERRTMVEAVVDGADGLCALNEIFVGHRSHQSARYRIEIDARAEEQSSSGIIVATGTGRTGWARSIGDSTGQDLPLRPEERALGYWVREPFPSVSTTATLRAGKFTDARLSVTSRMENGVVFADGIEKDFLPFDWGCRVELFLSARTLDLVTG